MKLISTLVAMVLLASCATYQYFTLDGEKAQKTEKNEVVWENDSVRVAYDFNGRWGTMAITASNKSGQPLYINWQKSVIIQDGRSYSLFDPSVQLKGDIYRNPNASREDRPALEGSIPVSTVNASLKLPEGIDFMAPGTYTSRANINISAVKPMFALLGDTVARQKARNEERVTVRYKKARFNPANSPFRFQVYLSFGIGTEGREFTLSHPFYVAELVEAEGGPGTFALYKPSPDLSFTTQ